MRRLPGRTAGKRTMAPRGFCPIVVTQMIAVACLVWPARAHERRVQVSGTVHGASGQHTIHILLWDQHGFLRTAVQESFFPPQTTVRYAFAVPVGQWAIAASEDRNENGALDIRRSGPTEPIGFRPAFSSPRRPRFADVAVSIDHDVADADITLRWGVPASKRGGYEER